MKNYDLNRASRLALRIALIIAIMAGCIYSSRVEYNDDVLSGMSSDKYDFIRSRINDSSRSAGVSEYMSNKQYYDSLDY